MNKNIFLISSLVLIGVTLASCGAKIEESRDSNAPAAITAPEVSISSFVAKKETPRYNYTGDRYRDPFIPLNSNISMLPSDSDEIPVPNIGSLSLKGILYDGKQKIAIINGGGITYMLKDSRLFDNRQRLVRGITGAIKKEAVIIIAPDKSTKELTLRQKD